MKFGAGNREHNYVTHTLAEHHRIVREGNRFKKDISKVQKFIADFILEVAISERKKVKGKSSKQIVKKGKKGIIKGKEVKKKKKKKKVAVAVATNASLSPPPEEKEGDSTLPAAPPVVKKLLTKKQKKASERLDKIKRGGRKRMSRAEVDTTLKESLMRLSDWSQRACDVMQQQMKDITKLYMATMDYNIHLNSAYPVPPPPQSTL